MSEYITLKPLIRPRGRIAWANVPKWQALGLVLVVGVVAYLSLVPLGYLLYNTFFPDGQLSLASFDAAYSNVAFGLLPMTLNSLRFAVGATLLSVCIGTLVAYLTVRTDVPVRTLVFAAALVPLIIPGVLHTISWIFLGSPGIGWLNLLIEPLVGPDFFNVYTMAGMIFVEALNQVPLVFLLMYAAFRNMDPSLEESALMSGARLPTVFRRITLPMVRPSLYAAILIMLVLGLESFEVPTLLGTPTGIYVFTSRIYRVLSEFPVNYGEAGAYSVTLLTLTVAGVLWQSRLTRRAKAYQTVSGKGFRPQPMRLGKWRWVAGVLVFGYLCVAVVLPITVLVYMSLQPFYSVPSLHSLANPTLSNYAYTFSNPQVLTAIRNSTVLALSSATLVMLAMAMVAWVVVRTRLAGRHIIDNLAFLPITIPGVVMGVALLTVYLRIPAPIYGTLLILFIAYFTRYMPYGMRYASASIQQISSELEESAQACGAGWWQTFRRVLLPLMLPGFIAGWIYIVMGSIRELSSSILLYSPGNETLGIYLWEQWENGRVTELAAAGVVLMVLLVLLVVVAQRFGANLGVRDR